MRVADLIFQQLKIHVDTVFYLPGGGAGALVDALGQSGLRSVACLHEQGAGYAAVGYAMIHGFGVCLTTSGPGATNAITPCLAAWLDSIPVLFISGQVMRKWLAYGGMRSRGTQEGPTLAMVKHITKMARMADRGWETPAILDMLIKEAKDGRPGPVWLDVPMDVQAEVM